MTLAGFPIAPTLYFPLLYITSAFLLLSPPSLMLSALRYDLSFFVMAFIGFIRRSPDRFDFADVFAVRFFGHWNNQPNCFLKEDCGLIYAYAIYVPSISIRVRLHESYDISLFAKHWRKSSQLLEPCRSIVPRLQSSPTVDKLHPGRMIVEYGAASRVIDTTDISFAWMMNSAWG